MRKIYYVLMISISVLIFSCERNSKIGYSIIPEGDLLKMEITDTFTIVATTQEVDSLITSNVSKMLVGKYTDPIFGITEAGFMTEFMIGPESFTEEKEFIPEDELISIILTIPYNIEEDTTSTYYGDISQEQIISVYRLDDTLQNNIDYYYDHDPNPFYTEGEELVTKSFFPQISDNEISFILPDTLARELFWAPDSIFEDQNYFIKYFKGLYFKSGSSDNAAVIEYLINDDFKITINWKDVSEDVNKVFVLRPNNSYLAKMNMFVHDYTGFPVENTQDSVVYIQGGGGSRITLNIPHLKELNKQGNIVIHRAELLLKTADKTYTSENIFPVINTLNSFSISGDEYYPLTDYIGESGYYGQKYSGEYYKFDIALYVQEVLSGIIENDGLVIYHSNGAQNIERSVIRSGANGIPTKLIVTYAVYE